MAEDLPKLEDFVGPDQIAPQGHDKVLQLESEQAQKIGREREQALLRDPRYRERMQMFVRPVGGQRVLDNAGGYYPQEGREVSITDAWAHRRIAEGTLIASEVPQQPIETAPFEPTGAEEPAPEPAPAPEPEPAPEPAPAQPESEPAA